MRPSTARPAHASPPPRGWIRGRCAVVLVLLLVTLGAAPALGEAEQARGGQVPYPHREFGIVVKAWTKMDAPTIIAQAQPRGLISLYLLSPAVSGSFKRAQAQRTLQNYFRQVSGIRMKDVTPRQLEQAQGYVVRHYDYTYAPRGRDRVTTRLHITLKHYGRGTWRLDKIQELQRPRR